MPKHFELKKIGSESKSLFGCTSTTADSCYFSLVFITAGEGLLSIDLHQQVIGAGFVLFIKPGQFYRVENNHDLEGHELSFNESFLGLDDENSESVYAGNLSEFFSQQVIRLDDQVCKVIYETLGHISKEQDNVQAFQRELLKRYFRILLIYLDRQVERNSNGLLQTGNIDCVKRFLSLVDRKFKERMTVCDYAMELCMTPNYLNQVVKKVTTHSAGYHIRQRIVLEAQRKAIYSNKTMKEIAYSLGFNDCAHFSKMFKRVAGVNFANFKRDKLTLPYAHGIAI